MFARATSGLSSSGIAARIRTGRAHARADASACEGTEPAATPSTSGTAASARGCRRVGSLIARQCARTALRSPHSPDAADLQAPLVAAGLERGLRDVRRAALDGAV